MNSELEGTSQIPKAQIIEVERVDMSNTEDYLDFYKDYQES